MQFPAAGRRASSPERRETRRSRPECLGWGRADHPLPGEPLRLRIDHTNYRAETEIGATTRASLLRDLRGETPLLLDPATAPTAESRELLLETGGVRAYRLRRPIAAEHVIVEPLETSASLLEADPDLLGELMAVVQRFARELMARGGGCRVTTRVTPEGSDAGAGLQWHVVGEPG